MRVVHAVIRVLLRLVPCWFKPFLYEQLANASTRNGHKLYTSIFRLPFNLVLKSSLETTSNEACGLQVAGSIHGVHAPLLIDHVSTRVGSYTLMTWVDGDCCADIWDTLTPIDKTRIVSELRAQIGAMRQQTAGRSRSICATSGDFVSDPRIPWLREKPCIFSTPSDFFKQVWIGLDFPHLRETVKPIIQPLVDRHDTPIVFCHGDILPKNLILPGGLTRWRSRSTPVCLIDWEYSGWMPLPWEALKATWLVCDRDEEEWYRLMQDVFPESEAELEADWLWRTKSNIPIL